MVLPLLYANAGPDCSRTARTTGTTPGSKRHSACTPWLPWRTPLGTGRGELGPGYGWAAGSAGGRLVSATDSYSLFLNI